MLLFVIMLKGTILYNELYNWSKHSFIIKLPDRDYLISLFNFHLPYPVKKIPYPGKDL